MSYLTSLTLLLLKNITFPSVLFPLSRKFMIPFLVLGPQKHLGWMVLLGFFFFQKYWTLVKQVVLSCVWNFFNKHHFLKEHNHTFIALVPKQVGPYIVHHFRPISLCDFIYKIISKILTNRLKVLLYHFISLYQSPFVLSRTIQDNSIMAHELLHTLKSKRGRGGLMAVKIDMAKAFDRMEWDFLLTIMIKLGFHPIWVN
jgi:hypothetical protein